MSPRARLPGQPSTSAEPPQADLRLQHLMGATIHPTVATEVMAAARADIASSSSGARPTDVPGPVQFDGTGRIVGLTGSVPAELASRLEAAVIRPLAQTKAGSSHEAPRTERSILTAALHALRSSDNPEAAALASEARTLFLSAGFSRPRVAALIEAGMSRLAGDPVLHGQFKQMASELKQPVTPQQLADNLFGRTFESVLAEDLVRNPTQAMLQAAGELGQATTRVISGYPAEERRLIAAAIGQAMNKDWRPWYPHSDSLTHFLKTPSPRRLQAALADVSTGIDAVKNASLTTWMARSMTPLVDNGLIHDVPEWFRRSTEFYQSFVEPQKPPKSTLHERGEASVMAREPGNWLHYQPNGSTFHPPDAGKSWVHNRTIDHEAPSEFTRHALSSSQTVVNGMSGLATILAFFGNEIAQNNPHFSLADHDLNTMAAMVFDGGHSTEEVLSALKASRTAMKHWDSQWWQPVAQLLMGSPQPLISGYEGIAALVRNPDAVQDIQARLEKTLDRTLDYYGQHTAA